MTRRKARRFRPGFVYEFWGYDPRALLRGILKIVLLYVGQTRQKPETRWRQHQYGSPNGEPAKVWWPLVVERKIFKSSMLIRNAKLDGQEIRRIVTGRPLMNYNWNKLNANRIPKYDQPKVMAKIAARGGVAALVKEARQREGTVAGWSIDQKTGAVTWYGPRADRYGSQWLPQSTHSLSSSELASAFRPASLERSSA
jgi:hypothetical protein